MNARSSMASGLSVVEGKEIDLMASGSIPQLDPLFPASPRLWGGGESSFSSSVLIYRAITVLTDYMKAVPLKFVDPKDDTKEVFPRTTDAAAQLFTRPNSIMNGASFREMLTGYDQFHGGYIVALVGASGDPVKEKELPVSFLPYPIKGWKRVTADGSKDPYKTIGWTRPNKSLSLLNHQCVVFQSLDVSGRFGIVAPADLVRDAAETQAEVDSYQAGLLRNNGRPGIVISTNTHVKKPLRDRFMAEWQQNHGGPANAGRPAFLTDADWKISPIDSLKLGDITSVNQLRDSIRKVGLAFKVPEMEFGITENVRKDSSAQIRAMFLTGPVETMFRSFEAVWNDQFCDRYNLPYHVRLDQWALSAFRDVMQVRLELVAQYIQNAMTPRDAYKLVGVPYVENDQMGRIFMPSTLQELTAIPAPPPAPAEAAPPPDGKAPETKTPPDPDLEDDTDPEEKSFSSTPIRAKRAPRGKTAEILTQFKALGDKKRKELGKQIWAKCVEPFEPAIAEGTTKAVKRFKGHFLKRLNYFLGNGKHLSEDGAAAKDASVFIDFKASDDVFLPMTSDFDKMMMPKDQAVAGLQAAWRGVFADVETVTTEQMETELGELSGWLSQPPEAYRTIALNRLGDAVQVDDTTRTQLKTILTKTLQATPDAQPVQIARALREEANHVFNNAFARANTIARTEVGAVMGDYRKAIMLAEGVKTKRWSSAHDPLVRPTHSKAEAEGAIPMNQSFGNKLDRPHDPDGDASEVCNCRCVLLAG